MAIVTRDVDPVEALSLLRGDWHSGYDPSCTGSRRSAPRWPRTRLHAVGFAHAAKAQG